MNLPLPWRLARRELRGGVRGLRGVVLCLAIGVATIAAVGGLRAAVDAGMANDGRRILGGDLEVDAGPDSLPPPLLAWLKPRTTAISEIVQMRSIVIAASGERQLVELKAVDATWPLVGTSGIDPPQQLAAALAPRDGRFGILLDPTIVARLNLKPGDSVKLGNAQFRVAGALTLEPDRVVTPSLFGARALISADALPSTGLVLPGAMLRHALRLTTNDPTLAEQLRSAFPDRGLRLRDPHDAAPGVTRFLDQTSLFLTLVGLTSLLVGGIGVANGVRAWLDARSRTIATLRCLGASAQTVFAVCLIQVMALAGLGIGLGLAAGAVLPIAGGWLLRDILPVPAEAGIYPAALALAAGYGVLTAFAFALWPLGRAAQIPGAALFREIVPHGRPAWPIVLTTLASVAGLGAVTIATAPDRRMAYWFCLAALATLGLFQVGASALMRVARLAPTRRLPPWARLGIANLYRPGATTSIVLVSVGLGLSTLATVASIQGNIGREVMEQMPANAPTYFFIDIQSDQIDRFSAIVQAQPGTRDLRDVPSLRARIVAVKGVPVDRVQTTPETAFALKGDRGLTYAATPPPGTRLTAGTWWAANYDGPPLVSFDAGLAKGWGVGIGDVIRVNVLGRDLDLKVANLRDIAWQSLSINFFMVASPGILSGAPHTHIATVHVDGPDQASVLRAITDALPNVTGILVADVLASIAALLNQIAAALSATGGLTLIAGAVVLAGAVAAGQRRRTREAVILRTLGATRAQIRAAWLTEFGLLGLTAGVLAGLVGSGASFAMSHYILHSDWVFLPGTLISTLAGAFVIMLIFGHIGTAAALRAKPASQLRNE
jgi:putative ABC transport system permease protein